MVTPASPARSPERSGTSSAAAGSTWSSSSTVTGTTRHYDSLAALERDTQNARIWLGLHFRRAMTDGLRIGQGAAAWVVDHELRPRH